jgi:uncharacterized protein YodC (DUF2158 family)
MSIAEAAVAFAAATKKRAQARSHLSALRKKWLVDYDTFFDKSESSGDEGYEAMLAALKARETANAEYRRAKSRLFRACAALPEGRATTVAPSGVPVGASLIPKPARCPAMPPVQPPRSDPQSPPIGPGCCGGEPNCDALEQCAASHPGEPNKAIFPMSDLVRQYAPPNLREVMPGNKVMLRSGGPQMTVSTLDAEGRAVCQWEGDGELKTAAFSPECLTCYGAK